MSSGFGQVKVVRSKIGQLLRLLLLDCWVSAYSGRGGLSRSLDKCLVESYRFLLYSCSVYLYHPDLNSVRNVRPALVRFFFGWTERGDRVLRTLLSIVLDTISVCRNLVPDLSEVGNGRMLAY